MLKKYRQSGKLLSENQLKGIKGGEDAFQVNMFGNCVTTADCPIPCGTPWSENFCNICYKGRCILVA
jgi:hypothetical protein